MHECAQIFEIEGNIGLIVMVGEKLG